MLGSSYASTHCKNIENCFYLCPGLDSMMILLILFAFVVGYFFPEEWQMVNFSFVSFDEQCVLF